MAAPLLTTKLFRPPARPLTVPRPRLVESLSQGQEQGRVLTLISAPAGFGKSTLPSAWIDQRVCQDPKFRAAWLSLDEQDSDPSRFLLYLAAALHGIEPSCGADAMAALQSPQPPSAESILTELINEIDGISGDILLVFDGYHAVHSRQADEALGFLLEHLPVRRRQESENAAHDRHHDEGPFRHRRGDRGQSPGARGAVREMRPSGAMKAISDCLAQNATILLVVTHENFDLRYFAEKSCHFSELVGAVRPA